MSFNDNYEEAKGYQQKSLKNIDQSSWKHVAKYFGFIKTDMTDKINDDFKKILISKIPSGDLGTGEDVSNCVAFLASDMAKYVNGETLHVNGGMYMA